MEMQENTQDKLEESKKIWSKMKDYFSGLYGEATEVVSNFVDNMKDVGRCAMNKSTCNTMTTLSEKACKSPTDDAVKSICKTGYDVTKSKCKKLNVKCGWEYTY